jgi:hypothetical protein
MVTEYTGIAGETSQDRPLGRIENDVEANVRRPCVEVSTGLHRHIIGLWSCGS